MENKGNAVAAMEEQAKANAQKKAAQSQALGKVIQVVVDKLKEHLIDEIEYFAFGKEPPMFDQRGSQVAIRLWKANKGLSAEFVNKNSDNLDEAPLARFFAAFEKSVNNAQNMLDLGRRIQDEGIDKVQEDIFNRFFSPEFQIQTIKTEEFIYIGTVNKFGKPDGMGRMVFPNNGVYEGAFKNGDAAGYGRRFESNGSIYTGMYLKGIRHGRGILIDKKGVECKGNWWHYTFEGEIKKPEVKADA